MKKNRNRAIRVLFMVLFCVFLTGVSDQVLAQRNDNWVRVRQADRLPEDTFAGGNEQDGKATYVCRTSYRGDYIAGRLLDGRCFFYWQGRQRDSRRFEVLVGRDFDWKKSGVNYDYAVIAGGNSDNRNYYVCRVEYRDGNYIGNLDGDRCYYTRDSRGYSTNRFEVLIGDSRANTLLYAASRGDSLGVRDALRAGQAINQTDRSGKTALMLAAENGYERVVSELIYERAAVDVRDREGNTALILAAARGHSDVVNLLLREGANFNARNNDGDSAFTLAAANGREQMVRDFLRGTEYFRVDEIEAGRGFRRAASNGHTDVLQILLNAGVNVDSRSEIDGKTALMEASAGRQLDTIRFLLRNDANLNAVDNQNYSSFQYAVLANSDKTLRLFLTETDINAKDFEAERGLRLAAQTDKRESLEFLIQQGVNVNSQDDLTGNTALILAAGEGNESATEMLVKARADLNFRNQNGETALMLAAARSKNNTTKVLVKAGADLNLRDNNGLTALGWAIRNKHDDTRKTLQKAGAKQ